MTDTLQTTWTSALGHGRAPDADALVSHLRSIHREHTGFTEGCAGECRDGKGRTSYQWLAEMVDRQHHNVLLDVACGSGLLLALCHETLPPQARLIGVDMSPDELALASARLPQGRAELIEGHAQNLSGLADGSVDIVLCHWALTLMDPIAPVLAEIARVLGPGGRFAAIVDGPMEIAPGYQAVHDLIYGHVQKVLPVYGTFDLGDPRIRSAGDLVKLIDEVFPAARVIIDAGVVSMSGPPAALAQEVAGFFYAAFVLSDDRRASMLDDLAALLARTAKGNTPTFAMPINRLVVDLR